MTPEEQAEVDAAVIQIGEGIILAMMRYHGISFQDATDALSAYVLHIADKSGITKESVYK